jgi:hypothetical protein
MISFFVQQSIQSWNLERRAISPGDKLKRIIWLFGIFPVDAVLLIASLYTVVRLSLRGACERSVLRKQLVCLPGSCNLHGVTRERPNIEQHNRALCPANTPSSRGVHSPPRHKSFANWTASKQRQKFQFGKKAFIKLMTELEMN